jgi:hypothetical protein
VSPRAGWIDGCTVGPGRLCDLLLDEQGVEVTIEVVGDDREDIIAGMAGP